VVNLDRPPRLAAAQHRAVITMTVRGSGLILVLGSLVLGLGAAPAPAPAVNFAGQREDMVRLVQLETLMISSQTGVAELDPRVLAALRQVPREAFVPEALRPYAYEPHPLPVGYEQNLAAPLLVALMTHLVAPQPTDVVFETGTGAGYHAAVLSLLAAKVYSVEVVEPLADQAARILKDQGYDNVYVQAADGYYGWPAKAPFDAMVIKEAIDHVPAPLLQQLKRGGRMVIPVGPERGVQYLTLVTKDQDGRVHEQRIMPVRFSPLQGGERL
jgi:protein-L-isoaspartate(D-aspartate) O-methyltransferase